jgi:uncharacterized protein YbbC (DUF1343 family)
MRVSLALVLEMRNQDPKRFAWRTETYEFVSDPIAIDLLFGSSTERLAIEQGAAWQQIASAWESQEEEFAELSREDWMY